MLRLEDEEGSKLAKLKGSNKRGCADVEAQRSCPKFYRREVLGDEGSGEAASDTVRLIGCEWVAGQCVEGLAEDVTACLSASDPATEQGEWWMAFAQVLGIGAVVVPGLGGIFKLRRRCRSLRQRKAAVTARDTPAPAETPAAAVQADEAQKEAHEYVDAV